MTTHASGEGSLPEPNFTIQQQIHEYDTEKTNTESNVFGHMQTIGKSVSLVKNQDTPLKTLSEKTSQSLESRELPQRLFLDLTIQDQELPHDVTKITEQCTVDENALIPQSEDGDFSFDDVSDEAIANAGKAVIAAQENEVPTSLIDIGKKVEQTMDRLNLPPQPTALAAADQPPKENNTSLPTERTPLATRNGSLVIDSNKKAATEQLLKARTQERESVKLNKNAVAIGGMSTLKKIVKNIQDYIAFNTETGQTIPYNQLDPTNKNVIYLDKKTKKDAYGHDDTVNRLNQEKPTWLPNQVRFTGFSNELFAVLAEKITERIKQLEKEIKEEEQSLQNLRMSPHMPIEKHKKTEKREISEELSAEIKTDVQKSDRKKEMLIKQQNILNEERRAKSEKEITNAIHERVESKIKSQEKKEEELKKEIKKNQ